MILRVLKSYGSITLQSAPKGGRRHFGVPIGGPFDPDSHALANALVGNESGSPALELSCAAAKLEILEGGDLAWVGAGAFQGCRNFSEGDVLDLPYPREGCRSYIALPGGIKSLGDHRFGSNSNQGCARATLARPLRFDRSQVIRVVRVVEDDGFWTRFLSADYAVDPNSNRIGVRFNSNSPIAHSVNRPSEPMDVGMIQLPPSGNPIVLGPDGPTIGGYPTLGFAIRADMPKIGQLAPGGLVNFVAVSPLEAEKELRRGLRETGREALLLRANAQATN